MFKQHSFFIDFWSRQQLSILLKDVYCDTLRRICHKCLAYSWCLHSWQAQFSFTDPFQLFCDQAMASSSYYANQTNGALIGIVLYVLIPVLFLAEVFSQFFANFCSNPSVHLRQILTPLLLTPLLFSEIGCWNGGQFCCRLFIEIPVADMEVNSVADFSLTSQLLNCKLKSFPPSSFDSCNYLCTLFCLEKGVLP